MYGCIFLIYIETNFWYFIKNILLSIFNQEIGLITIIYRFVDSIKLLMYILSY